MVRRLIQNFLHWLQPPETQVRESEHERQSPSPQPPLPPSPQQPPATNSSQIQLDVVPTPPPSNERPVAASSSLEQLIQPPAPAQASNFKVLLSDYRYSPNPAVQDLSQQLSQPSSQPESPAPDSPSNEPAPGLSDQVLSDLEHRFSNNTDSLPDTLKTKQESSPVEISTTHISQRVSHNNDDASVAESGIAPIDLTTEHVSQPEPFKAEPQPALSETAADAEIITKRGVVKLLFKLKQNNHHGYIAPNDGSKDIIFHQKYVGHEIFHQLERGMAVEVTAHITAGKAYADHVRIL